MNAMSMLRPISQITLRTVGFWDEKIPFSTIIGLQQNFLKCYSYFSCLFIPHFTKPNPTVESLLVSKMLILTSPSYPTKGLKAVVSVLEMSWPRVLTCVRAFQLGSSEPVLPGAPSVVQPENNFNLQNIFSPNKGKTGITLQLLSDILLRSPQLL